MKIKSYQLLVVLLLIFAFAKAQSQSPRHQRAKIFFQEENNLQKLTDLGIYSDHGLHKEGVFVISAFSEQELAQARKEGFTVEVMIPDLKAHFLTQNKQSQTKASFNANCDQDGENLYPTPDNFNLGSMGGYLTYQEVLDELDDMRAQYPNLISEASNISTFLTEGNPDNSVTPSIGGNGIKWLRISDNPDMDEEEPEILYSSIHHAREPMSLMQNIYLMWYLLENYETDPEIQAIVDNTELYFVPVLNPDGYLHNESTNPDGGGFWRKNRRGSGVDNNRNYDYHINGDPGNGSWSGPGSSSNADSEVYHGTAPFSEVENQAMKWFVEQHNFIIAINSHTFGRLLYYPFSYADVATPDEALFGAIGAELTSQNGYNALRDAPFSGDSDDFMYGTVGTHNSIFSFTPEVGTSFWPPSSDIDAICKEMMYQNITAAQMTNNFGQINATVPLFTGTNPQVDIPFNLRRLGVTGSGNFTITVQAISDNIASTGEAININSLAPLDSQSGVITITLDPETLVGEEITFDVIINNGLFDSSQRFSSIFGEPVAIFQDNGDSASVNFESNDWGTTTATFQSPSSSITDSPSGDYSNNENTSIQIAGEIDLSEAVAANINFYTRFDIETNWDYAQLEISTNAGASWEAQCTNLTSIGNDNQAEGEPLYQGTLTSWTLEEVDLSDYLGQNITARFQLVSDGTVTQDGFYFDDLTINILNEEALSLDDHTLSKVFTIFPNPVQNILTVQTQEDQYELVVHSISGQKIVQLDNQSKNTKLDLSKLESGIYFVSLKADSNVRSFKVIKQ